VLASRPIADPFTLLQCCPTGDGAAAIVLCADTVAAQYRGDAVQVLASDLTSGRYTPGFRDMTIPEITVRGAKEAYEEAGLGPEDVDVAEVHDAFTIAELLYYEAFGFCPRGEAASLLESGATALGGRKVVNPSGGLLAKGHPVGATGAAQVVEIVRQLRGECGARQVDGAKVGLTHATGGGISGFDHGACSIHIFAR
jgi:benzoylsuccinyl-CoA thiolase BbsB subunit